MSHQNQGPVPPGHQHLGRGGQRRRIGKRLKEDTRRSRHQSFDNSRVDEQHFSQPPDDASTFLGPAAFEANANSKVAARALHRISSPSTEHSTAFLGPTRGLNATRMPASSKHNQPKFQPAPSYDDWRSKERLKPGGRSKNEQLGSAAESWGLDSRTRKGMFQHEDSPPSRSVSPFRTAIISQEPSEGGRTTTALSEYIFPALNIDNEAANGSRSSSFATTRPTLELGLPPWGNDCNQSPPANSPTQNQSRSTVVWSRPRDIRFAGREPEERLSEDFDNVAYDAFGVIREIPQHK